MPRSATSALQYITNLRSDFVAKVFAQAQKEQDGLPYCPVNAIFAPFMDVLMNNQYYATLTDVQRDSVIDYELKILNQ